MFPTQNELTLHARKSIEEMRLWAAEHFGFTSLPLNLQIKFNPDQQRIAVGGWSPKIRSGIIRFNLGKLLSNNIAGMCEYASYARNPIIGGFETKDWRLWVDTVLAHELAHVIQYGMWRMPMVKSTSEYVRNDKGHGHTFRTVYAILRQQFINHRVEGRIGVRVNHCDFQNNVNSNTAPQPRQHTPEGQRVSITVGPGFTANVIRVGSQLQHPRQGMVTVVDYKSRNYKYPYIVNIAGRRLKASGEWIAACKPV